MPTPTRLILSEGDSDEQFFKYLVKIRKIRNFRAYEREQGEPKGVGSFALLLRKFSGIQTGSEKYKLIVVAADNDGDPEAKFRDVVRQIRKAQHFAVPSRPRKIARNRPHPAVAVLMVPWDGEEGNLETICYTAAQDERPEVAKCVSRFVKGTRRATGEHWEVSQLAKLHIRCLIASSCPTDPDTSLQYAWSGLKGRPTNLVPLTHNCFDNIVKWLKGLR